MRALEDALAIAQAAEEDEPHPLLQHPLQFDDEPYPPDDEDDSSDSESKTVSPHDGAMDEAFGTLHIDEKEKTLRFFGPSGGAEVSKSPHTFITSLTIGFTEPTQRSYQD